MEYVGGLLALGATGVALISPAPSSSVASDKIEEAREDNPERDAADNDDGSAWLVRPHDPGSLLKTEACGWRRRRAAARAGDRASMTVPTG